MLPWAGPEHLSRGSSHFVPRLVWSSPFAYLPRSNPLSPQSRISTSLSLRSISSPSERRTVYPLIPSSSVPICLTISACSLAWSLPSSESAVGSILTRLPRLSKSPAKYLSFIEAIRHLLLVRWTTAGTYCYQDGTQDDKAHIQANERPPNQRAPHITAPCLKNVVRHYAAVQTRRASPEWVVRVLISESIHPTE
jgi:hypothetical protein